MSWLSFFRVFRALRPLRFVARIPSLQVVVNSLIRAIPPLLHVLLVVAFIYLIFAILGVQLFEGRLSYCTDACSFVSLVCISIWDSTHTHNCFLPFFVTLSGG